MTSTVENKDTITNTENGDIAYQSYSSNLTYFKLDNRTSVESDIKTTINIFHNSLVENPSLAIQNLFHARDARNGKGFRNATLCCVLYLKEMILASNTIASNTIASNTIASNTIASMDNRMLVYKTLLTEFVKYGCFKDLVELDKMSNLITKQTISPELEVLAKQLLHDVSKTLLAVEFDKEPSDISLASKWAPTERSQYSEQATTLCKILNLSKKNYRLLLTNLRKHSNTLETILSQQKYKEINTFEHFTSKSLFKYNQTLLRTTNTKSEELKEKTSIPVLYKEYLKSNKKVNVKGVEPHDILYAIETENNDESLHHKMWNNLIDSLKNKDIFKNALSTVDCSGSMSSSSGLSFTDGDNVSINYIALSLGILIAECSTHFNNVVLSFNTKPELIELKNITLKHKKQQIENVCNGALNTNMQAVFDLLSNTYKDNTPIENQIDTLFIMTDGQFDSVTTNSNKSTFEYAKQLFQTREQKFPLIIVWNLSGKERNITNCPVQTDERGFIYLSGYSMNVLNNIDHINKSDVARHNSAKTNMINALSLYEVPDIFKNFTATIETNAIKHQQIYQNYFSIKNIKAEKTIRHRKFLKSSANCD